MKAIGYARTSTSRQDLSLEVQQRQMELACEMKGINELTVVTEQVSSGVSPLKRSQLSKVLKALKEGEADVLIVAKLDRVARSSAHIAILMDDAKSQGWSLIALDLGIDTTTPEGEMVVGIMASIAQWERARIRQRTREALQQAKENGKILGRPRTTPMLWSERAVAIHSTGCSLREVSRQLAIEGIVTANGRPLSPSYVTRLLV